PSAASRIEKVFIASILTVPFSRCLVARTAARAVRPECACRPADRPPQDRLALRDADILEHSVVETAQPIELAGAGDRTQKTTAEHGDAPLQVSTSESR